MNTLKLSYKGIHYQNFPYQLKLLYKIITRNLSSKEFQKNNIEFEKSNIFEGDCLKVFINLPNGVFSEKSFSTFKYKSTKFFFDKAVVRTICLDQTYSEISFTEDFI